MAEQYAHLPCAAQAQQVSLCKGCQEIHIDSVARLTLWNVWKEKKGLLITSFGTQYDQVPENGCPLCRFFHNMIWARKTGYVRSKQLELRAYRSMAINPMFDMARGPLALVRLDRSCFMVVDPFVLETSEEYAERKCFFIEGVPNSNQSCLMKPRLLESLASLEVARQWLDYCCSHHSRCRKAYRDVGGLRVLDCETLTTIQYPNKPYVALSYVWGKPADQNQTGSYTNSYYPRTIRDAIVVTKGLGYRYLWVDQYCIDQENSQHKMQQIAQMDAIYRNADMTIIAAAGKDAEAGLPGVGDTPRVPQPVLHTNGLTLLSTMTNPRHIISNSFWNRRGWTFQEAILSPRRLVFTEEQLYFECEVMSCHESMEYDLDLLHEPDKQKTYQLERRGIFSGSPEIGADGDHLGLQTERICTLRTQYTRRQLSYDSDSFNAFLGILQQFRFEGGYDSIGNVWGIAYSTARGQRRTKSFIMDLLWVHERDTWFGGSARRRDGFPSWTWIGWEGTVKPISEYMKLGECFVRIRELLLEYDSAITVAFDRISVDDSTIGFDYSRPKALLFQASVLSLTGLRFDPDRRHFFLGFGVLSLYLSECTDDDNVLHQKLQSGRYILVPIVRWGTIGYLLVLEDHGDHCTRIGVAQGNSEDCETTYRHLRLL